MFFDRLLAKIKEGMEFFKNNLMAIILSAIFMFVVIWAGNAISVVTSRDILDPLTIKIDGLDDEELSSVKVLSTLSRAGNTVSLAPVKGEPTEWNNPYQTFIKKLLIGLKPEYFENFFKVTITLGDKKFTYTKEQFLKQWQKLDISGEDLFLYDLKGKSDYVVYEAPENIKSNPLNVPFAPSIFSSINFNGSEKLIQKPLINSIKTFLLAEIIVFLFCFLLFIVKKKNEENLNKIEFINHQRAFIICGLSIALTFCVLFILNIFILHLYKPDNSRVLIEASKIYLDSTLPAFLPKPVERMQFVLSILFSPFFLLLFYSMVKKYASEIIEKKIDRLYYFFSIALPLIIFAIVYIGLSVSNFLYIGSSFSYSTIGKYLYGLFLFPLGVYFVFFLNTKKYEKLVKYFVYIFCSILIIILLLINIFPLSSESLVNDLAVPFHLDPVFYPTAQLMAGKIMLVNLTGLYGLFPVFLQGIFNMIGLSVLSFTAVMGSLLALSYLFLLLFLRKEIKNSIILLLGFSTIVFYFLDNGSNSNPYFQYSPIRILFPSLILWLVSFYAKNGKRTLYYLIFLVSAASILWNFDSGIIIFISWIIALCYGELYTNQKLLTVKRMLQHIIVGLFTLLLSFFVYGVYAFIRSGQVPNFLLLWQYQKMFFAGYFMIPMPFPHIWVAAALIFLVGLLLAIKGWWNNEENRSRNFMIFFLSVLGLGLFSYYEGRSHDLTFYGPLFTVIALLTILADILYEKFISNKKLYGYGILFLLILFFILSSPINLVYNTGKYYSWLKVRVVAITNKSETMVTRNVEFIKKNTTKDEKIVILSKNFYDGLFYGESGMRAALDLPASTDVFFKKEVDYLINFLKCNKGIKIFVYPSTKYYFYDEKVNEILRNEYVVFEKSKDDMVLLIKNASSTIGCSGF